MNYRESPPEMAEQAAIGALILNIDYCIEDALSVFGENGECFIDERLGWMYAAIISLYRDGDPVDLVTVCHALSQFGKLEYCGGAVRLAQLLDFVPTSANFKWYAAIVKQDFIRRSLLKACQDAGGAVRKPGADSQSAMQQLEEQLFAMEHQTSHGSPESIHEIMPRVFRLIHELRNHPEKLSGITTGINSLDYTLDYLRPETLNILAARPGVGKSALAINIALAAARSGHPVLFFSLEMGRESIVRRFLSVQAAIPWKQLVGGSNVALENQKISAATVALSGIPIKIVDSERMDMFRLRASARRFSAQHDGKMPLIIIDYLQLCVRGGKGDVKRHEAVGDFTRECKALSRELRCPFLILSQISREAKDAETPFKAKDCLKDSGNIEEDADTIMVVVPDTSESAKKIAEEHSFDIGNALSLGVVKNRDGEVGLCSLFFDKKTQSIESMSDFLRGSRTYDDESTF